MTDSSSSQHAMDAEIQFGALEESQPETRLPPDSNKHFSVSAYGNPCAEDLRVYVDLDVMRDIEAHAREDTHVELGGVMLGGQYLDENGDCFVVVTDSLRAEHYEATKGSFKFTHETWEQITRQREQFPDDLQMVGWYHTHPDWGVFLSGMDMFICDHFFNRPLDLALVVDPCRSDRGMFQWTGDPSERIRRTGGFYLIASRFRQGELEWFTGVLKEGPIMPNDPRFIAGGPSPAPVVNINGANNPWQTVTVMGMLTMQFLVLCLIAWKLIAVPPQPATNQLTTLEKKIDYLTLAEANVEASREMLRGIASQLDGGEALVDRYERLEKDTRLAKVQAQERVALVEKQQAEITALTRDLRSAASRLERKTQDLDELAGQLNEANAEIADQKQELERITGKSSENGQQAGATFNWTWIGLGAGLAAVVIAGAVVAALMMRNDSDEDAEFIPEENRDGPPISE